MGNLKRGGGMGSVRLEGRFGGVGNFRSRWGILGKGEEGAGEEEGGGCGREGGGGRRKACQEEARVRKRRYVC